MLVETEEAEYKGSPMIKIIEVDEEGNPKGRMPDVIQFGMRKAKAILAAHEAIKEFVEKNS